MYNHLRIDVVSASTQRTCTRCLEPFKLGEFRVTKWRTWHLDCFQPEYPTKINFSRDIELFRDAIRYKEKVQQWVDLWNQGDLVDGDNLPRQYFKNKVVTKDIPQKRLLLEIFKFLAAEDLEVCASLVCKQWHSISRSSELWLLLFETRFYPDPSTETSSTNFRSLYIRHRFQACWHCGRITPKNEVHYVCPYYRQPLCVTCGELRECTPVSLIDVKDTFGVSESLLQTLEIPVFQFGKNTYTYLGLASEKIIWYRTQRKRWLLEKAEKEANPVLSSEELSAIRSLSQCSSEPQCASPTTPRLQQVSKFILSFRKVKGCGSLEESFKAEYEGLKRRLKTC